MIALALMARRNWRKPLSRRDDGNCLAVGQSPRGNLWRDIDPEMRAVSAAASG